jgi:hypothetical protein
MTTRIPVLKYGAVVWLAAVVLGMVPARTVAAELKLEAVLVWGTNGEKPSDPNLKPVSAEIARKLACLPFKYTNYFEVNRKQFGLPAAGAQSVQMSRDCKIDVKSLDNEKVEVTLVGKGQPVAKITQELKRGKSLVTGGPAANSTAWFVVIKRDE